MITLDGGRQSWPFRIYSKRRLTTPASIPLCRRRKTLGVTKRKLKHCPLPRGLFSRQCKSSFDLSAFDNARRDVFAQRGAVFESVARAASSQPDVVEIGMAVNQEIAV